MAKTVSHAQGSLEPYSIGLKLRSLRVKKRLTLSRLAAETGLSTAMLSKLETDRLIPTLPTLATICRVYGVGLGHFFSEPARHSLSITRRAHLEGSGRHAEAGRVTPLSADHARLSAQFIDFEPDSSPTTLQQHSETVGVFYVLEGRLRLDAGGVEEILEAGDCVCIDTELPLGWGAADKCRCRVLAVVPAG
jgi:transcriptional regulator with XRE-family HTH domain